MRAIRQTFVALHTDTYCFTVLEHVEIFAAIDVFQARHRLIAMARPGGAGDAFTRP